MKTAKVPNCLSCVQSHMLVWHIPACGPRKQQNFVFFCGAAIALARMRNHVVVHLQNRDVVTDPTTHGGAEPCGFCGRTTGTCTTSIVLKKISSTCSCVVPLKHAVAMRKQRTQRTNKENMPRECPIPGCSATPWVLNIKTHVARCHPTVAPNTVDLTEWVIVSQDDEKKKGQAKKNPHGDEAQDHLESGTGGSQ